MTTSLQRDANFIAVGGGVFDDGSKTIAPISIASATGRVKVTAIVSGGSGSGYQAPLTGSLGQTTFTWATAPNAIVIDGPTYQKTNQDGTVNWSGTTTTTLSFSPSSSIFAVA